MLLNLTEDKKEEEAKELRQLIDLFRSMRDAEFGSTLINRLETITDKSQEEHEPSGPERVYEWTTMNEYWNSFELTPEFLELFNA